MSRRIEFTEEDWKRDERELERVVEIVEREEKGDGFFRVVPRYPEGGKEEDGKEEVYKG